MPRIAKDLQGKVLVGSLSTAIKELWYSRHQEPKPLEPEEITTDFYLELDQFERADLAAKIVQGAELTARESHLVALCILNDWTTKEASQEIGVSRSRVGQILAKAERKLLESHRKLMKPRFFYGKFN